MLIPHGTIVALVDGENFELFRNTGTDAEPELTVQASPKLDTSHHGAGERRDSDKGHDSSHHSSEDAHAVAAAEWLNSQVLAHKIDSLVVIAAPRTLGEMRPIYHGELESRLIKELSKNLVGRRGSEVVAALREH